MATHLATKTDLDSLRLATKADVELLRRNTASGFLVLRKDLDAMGSQIVIRLGALLVVLAGLVLGALQLG